MATIDWQSGTIDLEPDAGMGTPWSLVFASDWAPLEERADSIVVGKQFQMVVSDPMRFYGDLAQQSDFTKAEPRFLALRVELNPGETPMSDDPQINE